MDEVQVSGRVGLAMDLDMLRDHFAGQALVGFLAMHADPQVQRMPADEEVAGRCYDLAEAMLEEKVLRAAERRRAALEEAAEAARDEG
jgi:hypothetical protein